MVLRIISMTTPQKSFDQFEDKYPMKNYSKILKALYFVIVEIKLNARELITLSNMNFWHQFWFIKLDFSGCIITNLCQCCFERRRSFIWKKSVPVWKNDLHHKKKSSRKSFQSFIITLLSSSELSRSSLSKNLFIFLLGAHSISLNKFMLLISHHNFRKLFEASECLECKSILRRMTTTQKNFQQFDFHSTTGTWTAQGS